MRDSDRRGQRAGWRRGGRRQPDLLTLCDTLSSAPHRQQISASLKAESTSSDRLPSVCPSDRAPSISDMLVIGLYPRSACVLGLSDKSSVYCISLNSGQGSTDHCGCRLHVLVTDAVPAVDCSAYSYFDWIGESLLSHGSMFFRLREHAGDM